MKNRIITGLLITAALAAGCNDELIPEAETTASGGIGDPVTVQLSLDLAAYNLLPGTEGRSAETFRPVRASSPVMDVELTVVPDTAAYSGTRAGEPGLEYAVWGYAVFQFDGTAAKSKLVSKQYVNCPDGVIDPRSITLNKQEGRQRIVVIGNVLESDFSRLNVGGWYSVYETLQNDFKLSTGMPRFPLNTYGNPEKDKIVICGQTDVTLTAANPIQVSIPLLRSVSKMNFNIQVEDSLQAKFNTWDVSVFVPDISFYNIMGRIPVFPNVYNAVGLALLTGHQGGELPPLSTYVPVSLQHDVPGTSFTERVNNAPVGNIYLQITAKNVVGGVGKEVVVYKIPLGMNFEESYSIQPNCELNYTIRLKGVSEKDPHVVRVVPGYFAGGLKAWNDAGGEVPVNDAGAVKFRYAKRIEVYSLPLADPINPPGSSPSSMSFWITRNGSTLPLDIIRNMTSYTDGFENTKAAMAEPDPWIGIRPAIACYRLNGLQPSDGYSPADWYLPSVVETIGVASAKNIFPPSEEGRFGIWSSTCNLLYKVESGPYAYSADVKSSIISLNTFNIMYYVRAVRQIND
ncbi:hypothetical protein [Coprobacter tertius]|uniref:Major fimbrial subunit protein N-terminal domain-containing protein n=1 Tax=Coprobacter tertius TaxID=2944915 RepID=A0ABT1MHZ1_9BACT|nr:hypothetical protein [Coprobacter tertius]MCP9610851.1 hypothetical protein [Coprobacter tertius]